MPAKIRLSRHGRKARPFYYIVVADARSPRDGRYIERIGSYNPTMNPAEVELEFDKALDWVMKGAQPTDTCRSILSERGVMLKKHLLEGVRKGALNAEEAEKRFAEWLKEKESKLQSAKDRIEKQAADFEKKRLEAEQKINEARAAELAKKKSELAAALKAEQAEAAGEETADEEPAEETPAEEPVAEAPAEAPAEEEVKEEAPAEEAKEEAETEDKKEAPEASEESENKEE